MKTARFLYICFHWVGELPCKVGENWKGCEFSENAGLIQVDKVKNTDQARQQKEQMVLLRVPFPLQDLPLSGLHHASSLTGIM